VISPRLVAAAAALVAIAMPVVLGACGSDSNGASPDPGITDKDLDTGNFSDSTNVDNRWNPLVPGMQYVFEGRSNRGRGRLPHRVVFTVTDLTKVIDGVRTRVLWDRDINAGRLLEGELAFHAQDDDGNVWNFGEYPEEYEPGEPIRAPDTWLSGLEGARAGILMRADPQPGTPIYRQGWAPKIEFGDEAKVVKTDQKNCVPYDCYDDVVVTDETNPFEPNDGHQLKYAAPGVGTIRAAPGAGGKEREVLVLVDVKRLGTQARAKVREEALELDRRAHRVREDLFARTPPAQ
jgi:hypothetical protein